MYFIYIFGLIWLFRLFTNIGYYLYNKRLYNIWCSFFIKNNESAYTYNRNIINHFKNAGIKDVISPISVPTGFGMITTTKSSLFDNLFFKSESTISQAKECFLEAKGVYRTRVIECFNPFYWINLILFLPKNTIQYLGLNSDSILAKLSQFIYWIINSILVVAYQEEISSFVKKIIEQLFS